MSPPLSGISGLPVPLYYIPSLVLLPSPAAIAVLSFWPILLICFPLNLHVLKGRLFCVAFVIV